MCDVVHPINLVPDHKTVPSISASVETTSVCTGGRYIYRLPAFPTHHQYATPMSHTKVKKLFVALTSFVGMTG